MWQILKRLARTYVAPRKRKFVLVQVMHAVAVGLMLLIPWLIRNVIDVAIPAGDYRGLAWLAGAILGVTLAWAVMQGLKEYWGHEVAQRMTARLRNDLYGHLQKLSMSFHEQKKTGELLSRLVDDINVIEEFTHHGPETVIIGIVSVLGTGIILFAWEWRLAAVGLAVTPFLILYAHLRVGNMLNRFRKVRRQKAWLSDVLEENLAGIKVIQAFVGEDREADAVERANEEHYAARMGAIRYIATLFPGAVILNNLGIAALVLYGGHLAIQGDIKAGAFIAFIMYVRNFFHPILRMIMMIEGAGRFFAGIERFFQYMDIEPDIKDRPKAVELEEVMGEVKFEDVHFSYEQEPVLRGISLTAHPGQMVALVGPSGAGKTTITRLIPRFYDPQEGAVLLDGRDVRDLRLRGLRAQIGIVMQDDFLFSGSVAENIAYARPNASEEEIMAAALHANAAPFIRELPDGYDTTIGKRGVKLSEGQRQRISIARALLKNPQILILDEATSSVDSETELLIQEAIDNLRSGRTTFAIAHRLSTILEADQILFVQNGRIIERGTHEEMMALDGEYARFYRIQFGEITAASGPSA